MDFFDFFWKKKTGARRRGGQAERAHPGNQAEAEYPSGHNNACPGPMTREAGL